MKMQWKANLEKSGEVQCLSFKGRRENEIPETGNIWWCTSPVPKNYLRYFLNIPIINSKIIAPTVDQIMVLINVLKGNVITLASNPLAKTPITAPITPTMILPIRPKPRPFNKIPANQPATAPMASKLMSSETFAASICILLKRVDNNRKSKEYLIKSCVIFPNAVLHNKQSVLIL